MKMKNTTECNWDYESITIKTTLFSKAGLEKEKLNKQTNPVKVD